jgi:hypothetical protein
MITKGIVIETPQSKKLKDLNSNKYRVRIPLFESAGLDTVYNLDSCLCYGSQLDLSIKEGDVVFISFENNELDKPVILGKLYCDKNLQQDSTGYMITNPDLTNKVSQLQLQLDNFISNINATIQQETALPNISLTSSADRIILTEDVAADVTEDVTTAVTEDVIEDDPEDVTGDVNEYAALYFRINAEEYRKIQPTDELTICAYKSVKRRRESSLPRHKLSTLFSITFADLMTNNQISRDSKGDYIVEFIIPLHIFNYTYNKGGPKTRYIRIRRKLFVDALKSQLHNCYFSNIVSLKVRYDGCDGGYPIFQLIN